MDELPFPWPTLDEANGSSALPGIYRIKIEGVGEYVGRYTRSSRPLREYRNNVRKQVFDLPYRKSDPLGFRNVHVELFRALNSAQKVKIEIIENVGVEHLNERERYWINMIPQDKKLNGRKREK